MGFWVIWILAQAQYSVKFDGGIGGFRLGVEQIDRKPYRRV